MAEDLYDILNVPRQADDNEIRKQYRKLCLTNHPDKGGNAENFQKIQKAYEVLSDEKRRKLYDTMGITDENQHQQMNQQEVDIGSIFMNMFGGNGGPFGGFSFGGMQGRKRAKAPSKIHEIPISLYDFYHGKQIKIQFERQKFCSGCKGEGSKQISSCASCNGRGIVEQMMMVGPGMHAVSRSPCNNCGGNGKMATGKCDTCNGKKMFNQEKILEARIEPGMKPGDTLVFSNECSDDPNYHEAGDVHIKFDEADDTSYITRTDNDLYSTCRINFTESLLGMTYTLKNHPKYPNGLKIDIHKGVMNNEIITVQNEGMPKRNTKQFGNFYLKIEIIISEQEKQIIKDNEDQLRKMFTQKG